MEILLTTTRTLQCGTLLGKIPLKALPHTCTLQFQLELLKEWTRLEGKARSITRQQPRDWRLETVQCETLGFKVVVPCVVLKSAQQSFRPNLLCFRFT